MKAQKEFQPTVNLGEAIRNLEKYNEAVVLLTGFVSQIINMGLVDQAIKKDLQENNDRVKSFHRS